MPVDVSPATEADLDAVLPLFAGYQRFYENHAPDDARNRAFLERFLHPSDDGLLLVARDAGAIVGFATSTGRTARSARRTMRSLTTSSSPRPRAPAASAAR